VEFIFSDIDTIFKLNRMLKFSYTIFSVSVHFIPPLSCEYWKRFCYKIKFQLSL
jgi:hypothetical protein